MEHSHIGSNIRRLRMARNLTQDEVATAANISLAGLRNYETGRSEPRVDVLLAIAKALDARLDELVSESKTLECVRFRAAKRLNTRDAILSDVARWLGDFVDLEEITGDKAPWQLQDVSADDPIELARKAREAMKISKSEPIRNICGLLEKCGVKVLSRPVKSEFFFGLAVGREEGGPAVVVNTWDRIPVERWIFSAAHELGHILLHEDSFRASLTEEDQEEERQANQFASHFLMPEEQFEKEWNETDGLAFIARVLKVKRMFRVSYATVLYRLQESKRYSDVWKAFFSQYQRLYGQHLDRKREPHPLRSEDFRPKVTEDKASREPKRLDDVDFIEDRLNRLVRKALDDERITRDRAAEILRITPEKMIELIEDWAA